jgi:hypothetical protein
MQAVAKKFNLGIVVVTLGARDLIEDSQEKMQELLARHVSGDWGDIDDEDKALNDSALQHGVRLLSSYTVDGEKIWVITEADRSSTTILLPSEY